MSRIAAALLLIAAGQLATACGSSGVTPQGDPLAGRDLVENQVTPSCGACHTLAAAEFEGTTAPNLDFRNPGYETVYRAVERGPGVMPSYADRYTSSELHDIAAYVSDAVDEVRAGGASGGGS